MLLLVSNPLDSFTILSADVIHRGLGLNFHVEHAIQVVLVHVKGILLGLSEQILDFGDVLVHSLILSRSLAFFFRCNLSQLLIFDALVVLGRLLSDGLVEGKRIGTILLKRPFLLLILLTVSILLLL